MPALFVQVARDEEVLGEVPLAPCALTGVSEAQLARGVAQVGAGSRPRSERGWRIRDLLPALPVTARLAELASLRR